MAVKYDPTLGYAADSDLGLGEWVKSWFGGSAPKDPTGGGVGVDNSGGAKPVTDLAGQPAKPVKGADGNFYVPYDDGTYHLAQGLGTAPPDAPDRITQGGVVYERQPDGQWKPAAGIPAAGAAAGGMTAGQIADNAARAAALQETIRVNDATIGHLTKQDALAETQQRYLERKDAWAQANDDKRLALDTQGQLATIQQQRDQLNFQIQNAQRQSYEAQQALQQRNNEFNATQKLATDTANMQYADRAAQRLQQVNADIGTLGQDAGDRGRWASFVTANSGWGRDNAAVPGANLITDESAKPLENSLATRNALLSQNNAPFMFSPLSTPVAGPLTNQMEYGIYGTNAPSAAQIVQQATQAGWSPMMGGPGGQSDIDAADRYLKERARGGAPAGPLTAAMSPGVGGADRVEANQRMDDPSNPVPSFVPRFEDGGASVDSNNVLLTLAAILGMEPKAVAGEKGKSNGETVMSNGDVVVIPDKGKLASGKKKMATGGLNLNLANSPLTSSFLGEASMKARSGTPWAGGGVLPTPVFESSPGTDPGFAALLDSIRALEQGIPVDYSQRLAQKYRPTAAGERLVGRTA